MAVRSSTVTDQQGAGGEQVGPAGIDTGQGGPLRGRHAEKVLTDGVELATVTLIWLTEVGSGPPRRPAARAIRVSRVPLLPTATRGLKLSDVGKYPTHGFGDGW